MTQTREQKAQARTAWSFLLGFFGSMAVAVGVSAMFGALWAVVVVGGIAVLYSLVLALPRQEMWG